MSRLSGERDHTGQCESSEETQNNTVSALHRTENGNEANNKHLSENENTVKDSISRMDIIFGMSKLVTRVKHWAKSLTEKPNKGQLQVLSELCTEEEKAIFEGWEDVKKALVSMHVDRKEPELHTELERLFEELGVHSVDEVIHAMDDLDRRTKAYDCQDQASVIDMVNHRKTITTLEVKIAQMASEHKKYAEHAEKWVEIAQTRESEILEVTNAFEKRLASADKSHQEEMAFLREQYMLKVRERKRYREFTRVSEIDFDQHVGNEIDPHQLSGTVLGIQPLPPLPQAGRKIQRDVLRTESDIRSEEKSSRALKNQHHRSEYAQEARSGNCGEEPRAEFVHTGKTRSCLTSSNSSPTRNSSRNYSIKEEVREGVMEGMNALSQMFNVRTMVDILPPVDPFHGERKDRRTFEEFLNKFENKYRSLPMDGKQRIQMLSEFLKGSARKDFDSMADELKFGSDYDKVVSTLKDTLGGGSKIELWQANERWRTLRKNDKSMKDFLRELERLASMIYQGCEKEVKDDQMSMVLLSSLTDWPEHSELISIYAAGKGKAYERIKTRALHIETSRAIAQSSVNWSREWSREGTDSRTKLSKGYRNEYMAEFASRQNQNMPYPQALNHASAYRQPLTCYSCGEVGHVQRYCLNPANQNTEKTRDRPQDSYNGGRERRLPAESGRQSSWKPQCSVSQTPGRKVEMSSDVRNGRRGISPVARAEPTNLRQSNALAISQQEEVQKHEKSQVQRQAQAGVETIVVGRQESMNELKRGRSRSPWFKCNKVEYFSEKFVSKGLIVETTIEGIQMSALLDTGSDISLVSLDTLKVLCDGNEDRLNSLLSEHNAVNTLNTRILDASNRKMSIVGRCELYVKLTGSSAARVGFHVSEEKHTTILGMNVMKLLNLQVMLTTQSTNGMRVEISSNSKKKRIRRQETTSERVCSRKDT